MPKGWVPIQTASTPIVRDRIVGSELAIIRADWLAEKPECPIPPKINRGMANISSGAWENITRKTSNNIEPASKSLPGVVNWRLAIIRAPINAPKPSAAAREA